MAMSLCICAILITFANGATVEKRSVESDLVSSASGYMFRSDNGAPGTYFYLGAEEGGLGHYAVQPAIEPQYVEPVHYTNSPVPLVHYTNPYVAPIVVEDDGGQFESSDYGHAGDLGLQGGHSAGLYLRGDHGHGLVGLGHSAGYGGGHHGGGVGHHGHGYQHGGGGEYSGDEVSAHGNKGNKGFKSYDGFSKGEKGHHDKEGQQGHYSSGEGHNSGYGDQGSQYDDHYNNADGYNGGSFGEKKGHKKGEKTTGFHNVYHKDEYKKDHTFYDDADDSGNFNKYGASSAKGGSSKGGYFKGGKHDGGYLEDEAAKKGYYNKGFLDDGSEGYKSENGNNEYYGNYQDFSKGSGGDDGSEYGYKH